ncbi:hypothetical protein PIB30_035418 [Stylosanthes scabra]|uniref:RNase H type-1 domain-containing protein n=1 Tax=Stylosanthes scabra TaxID=79078 RepID=A0ABU6RDM4_9FABA|nr:hypothetical protein [Stylosanthes scabra]
MILSELIAIKIGLELAWSMQVPRLICESDCLEALKLCMNPKSGIRIPLQAQLCRSCMTFMSFWKGSGWYNFSGCREMKTGKQMIWLRKPLKDQALGAFVWDLPSTSRAISSSEENIT